MAEAVGLAASVIAITDVAVKAGSAYLKITRLLDEMKQVPTELRLKADKVRFLEDFLFYAEDNLSKCPLPSSTLLEDQISKCNSVLRDVKEMVDHTLSQIAQPTTFRRKIALTRAIFRREDLKVLEAKLDEALKLYQLAQEQYILTMMASSLIREAQESAETVSLPETVIVDQKQRSNATKASQQTSNMLSVCYKPTLFGRLQFAFQAGRGFQVAVQAPSWLTSSVYSVLAHRATVGWQLHLRAEGVVKHFDWELLVLIQRDDPQGVFRYLDEHAMSPFVRNEFGKTLLEVGPLFPANTLTYGTFS
ncbi:hypothetical protein CcaCcLH18_10584 [Colletotrichum camelliae]|nr:hypothetical protein CcaCcLH18_10584 [Colletotrichum camelliae]